MKFDRIRNIIDDPTIHPLSKRGEIAIAFIYLEFEINEERAKLGLEPVTVFNQERYWARFDKRSAPEIENYEDPDNW